MKERKNHGQVFQYCVECNVKFRGTATQARCPACREKREEKEKRFLKQSIRMGIKKENGSYTKKYSYLREMNERV